jgi:hypothetical protein
MASDASGFPPQYATERSEAFQSLDLSRLKSFDQIPIYSAKTDSPRVLPVFINLRLFGWFTWWLCT